VRVECVQLRVDHRTGSLEMADGVLAVPLSVLEDGEHGVTRRIAGTLLKESLEEGHGTPAAGLIVQLRRAFEGRLVIWRELQRPSKGLQCFAVLAHARQRDALQRPQLRVLRIGSQSRTAAFDGCWKVPGTQRRHDGLDVLVAAAGGTGRK
jgi:hypothetical protein